MTWFKVDDKFHDHRKAAAVGLEAIGLWTLAGSWCGDNLTDGFVPERVAARWSSRHRKLAAALVEQGLWVETVVDGEAGWGFHDWHEMQPLRSKVLAERAAAAERQRVARSRRESQRDKPVTNGVSHTTPTRPDPTYPPSPPCATCAGLGYLVNDPEAECPTCTRRNVVLPRTDMEPRR